MSWRRCSVPLPPSLDLQRDNIGCWTDYFSNRKVQLSPAGSLQATLLLSFPLTLLFAVEKARALNVLPGTSPLRIDLVGAWILEALVLEHGCFAELARGLSSTDVILRLVGPELQVGDLKTVRERLAGLGVSSMRLSVHKKTYQEVLEKTNEKAMPHLVVAPDAGIRESWFPALHMVCDRGVPLMATGYDLWDAAGDLACLCENLPRKPKVLADGRNPFFGHLGDLAKQKVKPDLGQRESEGELTRLVGSGGLAGVEEKIRASKNSVVTAGLANSHYYFINGYEGSKENA
mmetsp:Transcript_52812/g.103261  ORF Transcript_52812/g.103261 Transcript_52812/m.103261 type:complete len:290 (-) Transcript_52812:54-923(-)